MSDNNIQLEVKDLKMYFPVTSGIIFSKKVAEVKAVDGVSFFIKKGETLGLVGESGCGKTTVGRCISRLYLPTSGEIIFEGIDLCKLTSEEMRPIRRQIQVIFQDPYSSLPPRMKAADIIGDPLLVHKLAKGKEYRERVINLLATVKLNPKMADCFPHEFSGGQRQRIAIARAIAVKPRLIICDEPVSALDVSIQAQIINLLQELQGEFGLTYLLISHDMALVRHISDRIAVMYLGKLVELSSWLELYQNPLHPYTKALLSAVPIPSPKIEAERRPIILKGEIPSPLNPPSGCNFHPRCRNARDVCKEQPPQWINAGNEHWVRCNQI